MSAEVGLMDENRNRPGGKLIAQEDVVPPEFVAYLRWASRTGLYREWVAKGGDLEKFFSAWKRGDV